MTTSSTKSNTAGKQKQQRSKASEEKPKATRQDAYSVLKSEITRIARKEIKQETGGLQKSLSTYRSEIAALKRRLHDVERQARALARSTAKAAAPIHATDQLRFSAKGLARQRQRLGLSAAACGAP